MTIIYEISFEDISSSPDTLAKLCLTLSALCPEVGGVGCHPPDAEVHECRGSATLPSSCPALALLFQFSVAVKPTSPKNNGSKQEFIISSVA